MMMHVLTAVVKLNIDGHCTNPIVTVNPLLPIALSSVHV